MKCYLKTLILMQFLSAIFLTSCALTPTKVTVPKVIDISATEVSNKIPLRAGLYLSQNLRNAKYPLLMEHKLVWGEASAGDVLYNSTEKIINNIFQEVIIIDPLESTSYPTANKYDVIITPEVVRLDFSYECPVLSCYCTVQTEIKWNIVSPEGKEIYVSTIKSDEVKYDKPRDRYVELCIEPSLKNNFQKAQEDIYTNGWWKKQWWKDSK